jgi:DNA-binding transcriptional LysR family regulator
MRRAEALHLDFQIRFLRYFVAIVEERSFSRAADRLGISQPALSQRMQALEDQLGFPLLSRSARKIELTDEGRALLEPFRDLVGRAKRIKRLAEDLHHPETRPIRLGVTMYSDFPPRAALLNAFSAAFPETRIVIETAYTTDLYGRLLEAQFDFGVSLGPPPDDHFEYLVLRRFETEIIAPFDHPLAACPSIPLARLAGMTVATFAPHRYPALYEAAIGPLERAGAQITHPVDQTPIGLAGYAAQHKAPAALAFPWLTDGDLADAGVVRRRVEGFESQVALMLVRPTHLSTTNAERLWDFAGQWLAGARGGE